MQTAIEHIDPARRDPNSPMSHNVNRKKPPPPGGVAIYYVPSSRTVNKRTPLEEFGPGSSMGVLLFTVLDEGT